MRKLLLLYAGLSSALLFGQKNDAVSSRQIDSLIQVSRSLTAQKLYDKALETNAIAEKSALDNYGKESAEYGSTCFNHGRILYFKRNYSEAEKWYIDSRDIRAKTLGKENLDYAWSINNLANLYIETSAYSKAETLFVESRAIREKLLGREHDDYLNTTNNLAIVYDELGRYEQSEALYLEIIDIRAKKTGKNSPDYATSLNNLGLLYIREGQYDKAFAFLEEAKNIRQQVFGKEHPDYASSLNNLAQLYTTKGDYEQAEPYCIEAKNIREKTLGKDHPKYAWSLNNLANLYGLMGNNEKAEMLYKEAMELKARSNGKDNADYAQSALNLSRVYKSTGKYEQALTLAQEAQEVRKKALGEDHPAYINGTIHLANLYVDMRQYEKAEAFFLEALSHQKTLEANPEILANLLSNAADVYLFTQKYPKAEDFYLRAKDIQQKTLGTEHPQYAQNLGSLARLFWLEGKWEDARKAIGESGKIGQNLLAKGARHLSERELEFYIQKYAGGLSRDFSFEQAHSGLAGVCYDDALFEKGFLQNAVAKMRKASTNDPSTTGQFQLFQSYEHRLAAEYAKPLAAQKNIAELEEKANALEKELTRAVAGFGASIQQVSWQNVQQKLRSGEAAVEFVHYNFITPWPTDSVMYAALVITPDTKEPVFIPLFEEKQLKSLLQANGKPVDAFINGLYSSTGNFALYNLLWKPLEPVLNKTQTVYFSPSGLLHRLNLAAVPLSGTTRIGDRYQLTALGSTRQLVEKSGMDFTAKDALLYGGIQYDMDSTAIRSAIKTLHSNAVATRGGPDFVYTDSTLRGSHWNYLKWTDVEVSATDAMLADAGWKSVLRKGYDATEESFKAIGLQTSSPRVLHLATHGFFFPDPAVNQGKQVFSTQEPVFKISDHPLIRSGLLLAGANQAWTKDLRTSPTATDLEDGILTAYEISQVNLQHTELVVLSACETGLGDIQGNEGVYGLQRAFKIAGAKYLIMALWQVPDFQTQELITTFYSRWIEDKMPLPEAFHSAQKAMQEKYNDPFLWAGFVLVE